MNDLYNTVNSLEVKLSKLLDQYVDLQKERRILTEQVEELKSKNKNLHEQLSELENKHQSLRIANAMVGSKEDKHITKLKINTLIREIDKCIVQLSD